LLPSEAIATLHGTPVRDASGSGVGVGVNGGIVLCAGVEVGFALGGDCDGDRVASDGAGGLMQIASRRQLTASARGWQQDYETHPRLPQQWRSRRL
jgi:hypothetical protein